MVVMTGMTRAKIMTMVMIMVMMVMMMVVMMMSQMVLMAGHARYGYDASDGDAKTSEQNVPTPAVMDPVVRSICSCCNPKPYCNP